MRAIEAAMEESVDQAARVVVPPEQENLAVVARAHEALLHESHAGSAATFPLLHGGHVVGALTLERAAGHRFDAPTLEVCDAIASVAGPIVELKRGNEASLPAHAGKSVRSLWEMLAGPGHAGVKLGAAGLIAVAAFLSFASGDFRISANATLEGAVQRSITAPINGYVKASLRAGDTVAGQVIGRFDDRDLKLERSAAEPARPARATTATPWRSASARRPRSSPRSWRRRERSSRSSRSSSRAPRCGRRSTA
jgi:hypothetical protein